MVPYELLQNLNKLACVSKNKKIESLFLRLANENQIGFYDWLIKNKENKKLLKEIKSPLFMEAFQYLVNNMNTKPQGGWRVHVVTGPINYLPIYRVLFDLINNNLFKTVLMPLEPILKEFSVVRPDEDKSLENTIKIDLETLFNNYKTFTKEMIKSEHIGKKELELERQEKQERKRRERLHDAFGYFLNGFTNEILNALGPNAAWDKTKSILNQKKLSHYGEITSALPYIPNLGNAHSAINKIYNNILRGEWVKKGGLSGAFNEARITLFNSLDIPIGNPASKMQELDYESYFQSGEKPSDVDVMHPKEPKEQEEFQGKMKFNSESIVECSYILASSILLGKIQQGILQQGSK